MAEPKLTDLFEQAKARGQGPLAPDRHPTRDFFVADVLGWALKADRHSMEHPMFSLSKKPDLKVRHYEHNGNKITITPSVLGLATIWDKDILIYAISQLVEAINQGRPVNRTVRVTAYDLLAATQRRTDGRSYERLVEAFNRLVGTRIQTNITTDGHRDRRGFGLLEEWHIVEKNPTDNRMVAIELTLSEWLYRAVLASEVLTLSAEYFRLDGGLERRLYELARKHCGKQETWTISLDLLHKKSGSTASLRKFRQLLKQVNQLPDYEVQYQPATDQVSFSKRR